MEQQALFQRLTVHCFYGCGHVEREGLNVGGSSDAMERHYWDHHYTSRDRKAVRTAGQVQDRIGARL